MVSWGFRMPVYVYRCAECGRYLEMELPISDCKKVPSCDRCGSDMRRVFTPPFIRFVGPGFHVNDYSKGGDRG